MNRRTVLRGAVGVSAAAVAATITKVSKATYEDPVEAYRNFDVEAWRAQVPKIAGPWTYEPANGFWTRDTVIGEPVAVEDPDKSERRIHMRGGADDGFAESRREADAILRAHGWTLLETL